MVPSPIVISVPAAVLTPAWIASVDTVTTVTVSAVASGIAPVVGKAAVKSKKVVNAVAASKAKNIATEKTRTGPCKGWWIVVVKPTVDSEKPSAFASLFNRTCDTTLSGSSGCLVLAHALETTNLVKVSVGIRYKIGFG